MLAREVVIRMIMTVDKVHESAEGAGNMAGTRHVGMKDKIDGVADEVSESNAEGKLGKAPIRDERIDDGQPEDWQKEKVGNRKNRYHRESVLKTGGKYVLISEGMVQREVENG